MWFGFEELDANRGSNAATELDDDHALPLAGRPPLVGDLP
jgi:hypothetical protein